MTSRAPDELLLLIGEVAYVHLVEAYGGTRLYIPTTMGADHEIARVVGPRAAVLLVERMAPAYIRVPLAKTMRARRYRASGASNAQIARALGMTETGVEKLFQRSPDAPAKGSGQRDLFG